MGSLGQRERRGRSRKEWARMSVRQCKQGLVASRSGRARARVEALEGRALFAAGALDTGWGAGGFASADFPDGNATPDESVDIGRAIAVQADGRIVTAGHTVDINGGPTLFAVSRHTVDGDLDPTFGDGGKVVTEFA